MKLGIELEGFVYHDNKRVNLYQWLDGSEIIVDSAGIIKTDAGAHQLEISATPCEHPGLIYDKLIAALELLPPEWKILYQGEDPLGCGPWAPKSAYETIIAALAQETSHWQGVLRMPQWSALQIHLEVHPYSKAGIKLMNYLNNWAPAICIALANPFPSERLRRCWFGWADPRHLPAPRWFDSSNHLKETVEQVPKIIGTREAQDWWLVRARPRLGTIEFRALDSIPPDKIECVSELVLKITRNCLYRKTQPRLSSQEWWEMIDKQNQKKANSFMQLLL